MKRKLRGPVARLVGVLDLVGEKTNNALDQPQESSDRGATGKTGIVWYRIEKKCVQTPGAAAGGLVRGSLREG